MAPPRLQRYEIVSELGQGGMSVVYRARDTQLPREVAVKVLHEFLSKDPDARRRFHREAVAVAKLHHPGIVEIFDYSGPDAADVFIVTELIDGMTLRELVDAKGPLAFPELSALVVLALCGPLHHAHQAGVIHRDLKPENVMVARSGDLKLMDFGIAQMADAARVTVTGTLLGSPAHMAPEVIDGARPDARSDIFSLGTMLYWLATGKLPFEANNPSALFRRILEGEYDDPQQIDPRIGNGLAKIIRRAIERDPAARYPDAASLAADLAKELELIELVPFEAQVKAFLADPVGYGAREKGPLVDHLTAAGKAAMAEGNVARAMDRLSRVLASAPDHAEARALVARMGDREARQRGMKRAGIAAALLGVLGASGYWISRRERIVEPPQVLVALATRVPSPALLVPTATATVATASVAVIAPTPTPVVAAPSPSSTRVASVRPTTRPTPSPTRLEPPPSPTAAAVFAEPEVKIGGAFANVYVDGVLVAENAYTAKLRLPPGKHRIEVRRPKYGGFAPRILEVDGEGRVFEIRAGQRQAMRALDFKLPAKDERSTSPDWIPEKDESGGATAGGAR